MSKKVSFEIAAGSSGDKFKLYDRVLYARALTLRQLLELDQAADGMTVDENMATLAEYLTARVADGGGVITADWLLDNLTERDNLMLAHVLRNGRVPEGN